MYYALISFYAFVTTWYNLIGVINVDKNKIQCWEKASVTILRNSHSQMFYRIAVLKNQAKFKGKHLWCRHLFFLVSFVKFLRSVFLKNTSGSQLQNAQNSQSRIRALYSRSKSWKYALYVKTIERFKSLFRQKFFKVFDHLT